MNALMMIFILLSAGVVLVRCIHVITHLDRHEWDGHPLQFVGLSASYSLLAGGAVAVVFGTEYASALMLAGISGRIVFDRRTGK